MKSIPIDIKRAYTNDFILLGLFYFADKCGHKLDRMQTAKLLWKFKDLVQSKLKLQAYYLEPYKDKHGRFHKEFYEQVNDLLTANFANVSGISPSDQKFSISEKGKKIFDNFHTDDTESEYAFGLVKTNLNYIVKTAGDKTGLTLRKEDHQTIKNFESLPERDENNILSPNLKKEEATYTFLFNDQSALDWGTAIGIGERKTERIIPDNEIPKCQKEMYEALGV